MSSPRGSQTKRGARRTKDALSANVQRVRKKIAGMVKAGMVKGQRTSEELEKEEQMIAIGHAALGRGSFLIADRDFNAAAVALEACWEAWEPFFLGEKYFESGFDDAQNQAEKDKESSDALSESDATEENVMASIATKKRRPTVGQFKSATERAAVAHFDKVGQTLGASFVAQDIRFYHRHETATLGSVDTTGADAGEAFHEASVHESALMADPYAEQVHNTLLQELLACVDEDALEVAIEAQGEVMAYAFEEEEEEEEFEEDAEVQLQAVFNTSATVQAPSRAGSADPEASEPTTPLPQTSRSLQHVNPKPKLYQLNLLVQSICNAYIRLRRWLDLDKFTQDVLIYFGPDPNDTPKFASQKYEDLWVYIMIRRGLAAACLADASHLEEARGSLELALQVQPTNRELIEGIENLQFLESQLPAMGPGFAEDFLLARAKSLAF